MNLRMRGARSLWLSLILALGILGCAGGPAPPAHVQAEASRVQIDAALATDSGVEELIRPYRQELEQRMNAPLAFSPVPMRTGDPEGLLGALACDIVQARAQTETGLAVDAAVLNNGGLRISLPPGTITLGKIYEVMPFDNEIVVLRFSAAQMDTLANQLAERGGEPVSGLGLVIEGRRAVDVTVAGRPLEARDYWVATSDYLSTGGGGMPMLWEAEETRATGVMIRDALVDAFRAYGEAGDADGLGAVAVPEMGRIRRSR